MLKLGRQWLSPTVANWAIVELDKQFDQLPPGLALKLSSSYRTFSVPHITWINRAVRVILGRRQAQLITRLERDQMGADAYAILVSALELIEVKLKTIAAQGPGISKAPSAPCSFPDHEECRKLYGDFWWNIIARKMLLPPPPVTVVDGVGVAAGLDRRLSLSLEGFEQVKLLVESDIPVREYSATTRMKLNRGIARSCRTLFLSEARTLFITVQERVITAAVDGVKALYAQDTMQIDE